MKSNMNSLKMTKEKKNNCNYAYALTSYVRTS